MKIFIWTDTCTQCSQQHPPMITKMWKQPKCLPTGKWTKKLWHIDRYIHTHSGKPHRHSKRTKCCHLQQHGWAQRVSGLVKRSKANTLYYHFYVESKNFIPLCPPFPFGNQSLNVFLFFKVTYLLICADPRWRSSKESTCQCRRWKTRVPFLGWEDPSEKEMATHSSVPAWRIPRTEKPGGLQSMGL